MVVNLFSKFQSKMVANFSTLATLNPRISCVFLKQNLLYVQIILDFTLKNHRLTLRSQSFRGCLSCRLYEAIPATHRTFQELNIAWDIKVQPPPLQKAFITAAASLEVGIAVQDNGDGAWNNPISYRSFDAFSQ